MHQIDQSAAEVGPVRAKQLALRAAGISSRPATPSAKKQQQVVDPGVASEPYLGNDDMWGEASDRSDDA